MAKKEYTYNEICSEIKAKKFHPVYVLMGDEPYFIDRLTDLLIENVLKENERDFNQIILYGADTKATDILNAARRFSMMSDYQLVVVREAQLVNNLELLLNYVNNPLQSTILVINYKYKTLDRRKTFTAAIEKNGVLFDSKKIPDYKMPEFITSIMRQRGIETNGKAALMLADYLGNDLDLLNKELDKLLILLANEPKKVITPELIEKNVGISKDYNNFELQSSIANKDILKSNRIIAYFKKNPNNHPVTMTLSTLFNYFSNLLICYYSPDKSEKTLMTTLGFRFPIQVKDYITGLRSYPAMKVFSIIHEIRMADARTKGIEATSSLTDGDILKELMYKILH
ncbi:MAG: DNA polymerase III subunit delta [Tannerella sp.]|jgi:DNA polymerase-3 subunit delta|nr:DNA polymerase III subunit delta [Tannerella sp.]